MTGKQWGQWGKNANKSHGWGAKDKKGNAPQNKERALPTYDALPISASSGSGASSTGKDKEKDPDLKAMLQELIEKNDFQVPDSIKDYLQQDIGSTLNQSQKELNAKRKLAQRVDRLKAAQSRKQEQWNRFKQEMRDHMQKEKQRYDTESAEIQQALRTAQEQLDKAMSGVMTSTDEQEDYQDPEMEEVFQEMETEKTTEVKNTEKTSDTTTEDILKQTQAGHRLLAQQMGALQEQITYMAQAFMTPAMPSPTGRPHTMAPLNPTTPPSATRKSALAPFARRTRTARSRSPFNTPEKTKENEQQGNQPINLEGMDGYGPH